MSKHNLLRTFSFHQLEKHQIIGLDDITIRIHGFFFLQVSHFCVNERKGLFILLHFSLRSIWETEDSVPSADMNKYHKKAINVRNWQISQRRFICRSRRRWWSWKTWCLLLVCKELAHSRQYPQHPLCWSLRPRPPPRHHRPRQRRPWWKRRSPRSEDHRRWQPRPRCPAHRVPSRPQLHRRASGCACGGRSCAWTPCRTLSSCTAWCACGWGGGSWGWSAGWTCARTWGTCAGSPPGGAPCGPRASGFGRTPCRTLRRRTVSPLSVCTWNEQQWFKVKNGQVDLSCNYQQAEGWQTESQLKFNNTQLQYNQAKQNFTSLDRVL